MRRILNHISLPWALASIAMVAFIWGNSLVPGQGSSELSLGFLDAARGLLSSLGLPVAWLTNFVVRKTAHFTEYAVLGALVSGALEPLIARDGRNLFPLATILVAVPSIDETIQLFVAGRSGQVTDVLLDCCGAVAGCVIAFVARRALRAHRG